MATETMGELRGASAERDGAGASAGRPVLVHHVVARDGDKGLEVLRIPLEEKGETFRCLPPGGPPVDTCLPRRQAGGGT